MAKPNYSFEKRQRELAKKRKKEDKAAAKKGGGAGGEELTPNEAALGLPPVAGAPEAPAEADKPADQA